MFRSVKKISLSLLLAGIAGSASAFSLGGPFAVDQTGTTWQVPGLGYALAGDIVGPMNLTEEYRWNIKTITYGFDKTFLDYFGARGVEEVNKAIDIINALPPVSKMSQNLEEFPSDTRRINNQALGLNILDLKSFVLGDLMEQIGLADPERYTWCLRGRFVLPNNAGTNYSVIMRNFDPVTWEPSAYVNGTRYSYEILEGVIAVGASDALEFAVDPLAPVDTSVAGFEFGLGNGMFYTGLTRDDVGGIRYLLRKQNRNYENLIPGTTVGAGGGWSPVGGGGTNAAGTNGLVDLALRPGVDKIVFKRVKNQAGNGYILGRTNTYTDTYIDPQGRVRTQRTQRVLVGGANSNGIPDIIFSAGDIGVVNGLPVTASRNDTTAWANNSAINTSVNPPFPASGPGVIQPPQGSSIVITLNNVGPWNFNQFPGFTTEATAVFVGFAWGTFDGTTNAPILYPNHASIVQLEEQILSGNF